MLRDEAPNVVSRDGFRSLLEEGYQAAVVCEAGGKVRDNQLAGRWSVRLLGGEGRSDYVLVSLGGNLQARQFKTTLGLISFLYEMGFETVSIPLREGTSAIQPRPERASDRSPPAPS